MDANKNQTKYLSDDVSKRRIPENSCKSSSCSSLYVSNKLGKIINSKVIYDYPVTLMIQ